LALNPSHFKHLQQADQARSPLTTENNALLPYIYRLKSAINGIETHVHFGTSYYNYFLEHPDTIPEIYTSTFIAKFLSIEK